MVKSLTAGSRGSKLAMIQTESVITRLKEIYPQIKIEIKQIVTSGDRDRKTQLDRMDAAVFVKELEEALLDRRIDLAVHSLKDIPTANPQGLRLAAVTEREDPRDVLVARASLDDLPAGSVSGTGSLRRSIQLNRYRPDLKARPIRGNVDTRLRKVSEGEVDGIIVAAAGLRRLGLEDRITEYLPLEHFLPSAGQGALAIEIRSEDKAVYDLVSVLNDLASWQAVTAERAFLLTLGGGCRAPVAALGTVKDGLLKLDGMAASVDGKRILQCSEAGYAESPEEIGIKLAHRMLEAGADRFIEEVRGG